MNRSEHPTRRKFLGTVGAATLAANVIGVESLLGSQTASAQEALLDQDSNRRAHLCERIRRAAAQSNLRATDPHLQHPTNGDEELYPNKLGSYSKGLPHNDDGTVVASAYAALLRALSTGSQSDFSTIQ